MEADLGSMTRACKLSDRVLRHMVIKHPQQMFDAMVNALSADETSPAKDDVKADKGKEASDKATVISTNNN